MDLEQESKTLVMVYTIIMFQSKYLTNKNPFITNMFKNFHLLKKLKQNDITIVINDPTEISKENIPYLKILEYHLHKKNKKRK
jgi:hypothetical protein